MNNFANFLNSGIFIFVRTNVLTQGILSEIIRRRMAMAEVNNAKIGFRSSETPGDNIC